MMTRMRATDINIGEQARELGKPNLWSWVLGIMLVLTLSLPGGVGPAFGQGQVLGGTSSRHQQGVAVKPVQGLISKDIAMRSGPRDTHPLVAHLPASTVASILSSRNGWHELDVTIRGRVMIGWVPHKAIVVAVESAAPGVPMTGRVTDRVNVRAGPGTSNPVVAKGAPGQEVSLLSTRGDWYEVMGAFGDQQRSGWIRHDFIAADVQNRHWPLVAKPPSQAFIGGGASPAWTSAELMKRPVAAGERRVIYAGYSEQFLPVKAEMKIGRFDLAAAKFEALSNPAAPSRNTGGASDTQRETGTASSAVLVTTDDFLNAVEMGTLALDRGASSEAVEHFATAEDTIVERKTRSKTGSFFRNLMGALGETLTGKEEILDYRGEGYERILMLNYKTIAYLLRGERLAYNVTRRAIDWQNIEKRRFEEKLREAEGKLNELDRESKQSGGRYDQNSVNRLVNEQYAGLDARASSVPSAYVNPLGYYVAGVVHEFESASDITLRDNARISYEKALKLNPNAAVLRQAVADLSKPAKRNRDRLVHVVVAEGFAPEKKTLLYGLRFGEHVLPLKLPIYEPVPSQVRRIEVRDMKGKTLQVLSPLADVEAIALRHQKDSRPFQNLRVGVAVARSAVEKTIFSQLGQLGQIIGEARDAMTTPDMRAWMSLPARIHAARLLLPRGTERVQLVSIGRNGRELARATVTLGKGRHGFVYARSIEAHLVAYASETLWMDKQ